MHQLCGAQAKLFGFRDRGVIRLGAHADINIIDLDKLKLNAPTLLYDLPGGAKRLHQSASGYIATFVNGVATIDDDELTNALPGGLLRSQ